MSRILDIEHLLDRKPKALSGGQRQRVALGRAIVREPKVFLMDEPLSNLDAKLRVQMRTEISKLHQNLQTTFIYVTHDQTEALTMGTRIVVMKDGFIQQIDSPQELYDNPVNMFVAGFIGSPQMNFANVFVTKEGEKVYLKFGEDKLEVTPDKAKVIEKSGYIGKEVVFGIRPENTHDEPYNLEKWPNAIVDAKVEVTEMLGSETYLYLLINGINFTARVHPKSTTKPGDKIKIAFDMSCMHLFDKETEKTIVN